MKGAKIPATQSEEEQITRELISREAKIGGAIFGPAPAGVEREFFCLDDRTWVWHESWKDSGGKQQSLTTRYELRGNQIVKVQDGVYQQLTSAEKKHLKSAIEIYHEQIMQSMYHQYAN